MARPHLLKIRPTSAALKDISSIWRWTVRRFGEAAAIRYGALIEQALADIADDPQRPGVKARPDLLLGVSLYHLHFSRESLPKEQPVRSPRHFVVFRQPQPDVIEVLRILHDSRDLRRHLPQR